MKLLIVFVQKADAGRLLARLRDASIGATSLESEGGFLRRKNVTLLLALDNTHVPRALDIIRELCHARTERVDTAFSSGDVESVGLPTPTDITVGGATILVLDVVDVVKF